MVATVGAVVGYARLSTADQAKGLTLEQQVSRLREAGATEVLIDLLSGTSTARPKYRELLRRIGEGSVSKIVATRWDRICRSASETCRMVDLLCAEGAPELLLLDDPQDLSSIGGRAQLRMLGVFAQMEAERIRERSAAGKAHRKAKGLSDVAPFGMEICGGMLRPDRRPFLCELTTQRERSRADLLLEAFTVSGREGSMHAPWRHLGDTYDLWLDRTGMRRLLLNPALRGAKVGKRDKAKATWADVVEGAGGEPLIPPEEHQKYEAQIRGQMARRSAPDKRQRHVLAGKVLCGHCNTLMTRGTVTRSPHGRWFCRDPQCSWAIPRERRNSVMEPPLLEGVLTGMAEQAPAVAAAMERQAQRADESSATSPEVRALQEKRQRYLQLLADGDPVQSVIETLDQQIAGLLAAGPADGGGHLLKLREGMLRRERLVRQFPAGGGAIIPYTDVVLSSEEEAVATALKESWQQSASWASGGGERWISPRVWEEIRELVRVAVVEERRLTRLEFNL